MPCDFCLHTTAGRPHQPAEKAVESLRGGATVKLLGELEGPRRETVPAFLAERRLSPDGLLRADRGWRCPTNKR